MITFFLVMIFGVILEDLAGWQIASYVLFGLGTLILLLPVEGFSDPVCLKTTPLLQLKDRNNEDKCYYAEMKHRQAIFAFDNKAKYGLNGTAYEEDCVKGKIKLYESSDCKEPIMKEIIIKPIRGFLTFAPFSTKKEYIFYVPKGTVLNKQDKAQMRKSVVV